MPVEIKEKDQIYMLFILNCVKSYLARSIGKVSRESKTKHSLSLESTTLEDWRK